MHVLRVRLLSVNIRRDDVDNDSNLNNNNNIIVFTEAALRGKQAETHCKHRVQVCQLLSRMNGPPGSGMHVKISCQITLKHVRTFTQIVNMFYTFRDVSNNYYSSCVIRIVRY